MIKTKKNLSSSEIFSASAVIPVVALEQLDQAVSLAKALIAGGVSIMEVTLRTACALDAIKAVREQVPDMIVGAGTVMNVEQLHACVASGAQFVISPGTTLSLLQEAKAIDIPFIPGAVTMSEVQLALEHGYDHLKFFPAEAMGGVSVLKSYQGPVPQVMFCATGGVSSQNAQKYLELANVPCVGGSWIVPKSYLTQKNWAGITELCKEL